MSKNFRPAEPGMRLADVQTPALLVDLDVLDRNILALSRFLEQQGGGVRLRPHAKTHKSPDIAKRQVAAGAVGVCCQTVGEAEAMVESGIEDVLVSNQIMGRSKILRLAELARRARIAVCVDDPVQADGLSQAANSLGVSLDVLVELDVGGGRCGVRPGEPAIELARYVQERNSLRFAGLQAYHGRAQHFRLPSERRDAIAAAVGTLNETLELFRRAGLACPTITGAGTGTFEHESASRVYTELQCGSYVFMDVDYAKNVRAAEAPTPPFDQSLFVLSTVISCPVRNRIVCDAGLKAIGFDSGPPSVAGFPDVGYAASSDEHSTLRGNGGEAFAVGDQVRFVPGHCDPTVSMHDWLVAFRDDHVVDLWPIARGL